LAAILFVVMIASRVEDRRRRRRIRAALDAIITTYKEHESDQGRLALSAEG
jgi:hypothetical protein